MIAIGKGELTSGNNWLQIKASEKLLEMKAKA